MGGGKDTQNQGPALDEGGGPDHDDAPGPDRRPPLETGGGDADVEKTWRERGNLIGNPPVRDEGEVPGSGLPPNRGIVEDETVHTQRRNAAIQSWEGQKERADAMLHESGGLDNKYWFSKVYSYVTEGELEEDAARTFFYPSYVLQCVRYFEKIYEDNIAAADEGREVEEHWAEAFRTASDQAHNGADFWDFVTGDLYLKVRSLVRFMQAHIRFDLPRAEAWVFETYYSHMEDASINDFREDFMSMMGIFDRAGQKMNDDINKHSAFINPNWMPRMLQDTSMSLWFDADMTTERADTWERTRMLVEEGIAGDDPFSERGDGTLAGDVTADDHMSQLQDLSDENLRPTMEESADMGWDSDVRGRLEGMSDSEVAALPVGERMRMIRRLYAGMCFDDDEDAIIRIVRTANLSDVPSLVDGANAWDMLYATDGEQFGTLRDLLMERYYPNMSASNAITYVRRCMDGDTSEWEEQMVADILTLHPQGREVITHIGLVYEGGGFAEGLMKIEWQLDGEDEDRVQAKFGESNLSYGDEVIRDKIDSMNPADIGSLPVQQRVAMVRRLCQGMTLDDDEATIYSILTNSPPADQVTIIDGVGAHTIASVTHGEDWTRLKAFFHTNYYPATSNAEAFELILTCLNGITAEWEEEMVADLICKRSDGRELITQVGRHYEHGGFTEGLMKLEWQLDGQDQTRINNKYGESGYWFGDSAIRDRVAGKSHAQLQMLDTSELSGMITRLCEGSTGDDDEDTILRLVRAARSKGNLVAVLDRVGAWTLAYNMHGSQWTQLKRIYRSDYYPRCSATVAFDLIRTCMDGSTAEWEEEMIADLLILRSDGRSLIERIGRHYEDGDFSDGLNKVEWQLDGEDQDRVERKFGTSGHWW